MADRVARAQELLQEGKSYPRGCSEFVCAVLGIDYEIANDLMGEDPAPVGSNGQYATASAGDVMGWKAEPHGHVAIYTGNGFIDVREPGGIPRLLHSYGSQTLYKSGRY